MKKAGILTIIVIVLFSCSNYEKEKNTIFFDGQKFIVHSENLIQVITQDSISQFKTEGKFTAFQVDEIDNQLIISTDKQKFIYTKSSRNILERILVEFQKNDATVSSTVNKKDLQNLGGVIQRADRMDGRLEHKDYNTASPTTPKQFPNGLLSQQGFTILKKVDQRLVHNDTEGTSSEYFFFIYGDDYKTALKDFTNLNGKIPMLPKWSLGNWFSRYQPFKDKDYINFVNRFRKEKIPIDVIVPDMNWHKDGWYGTRFDENNFPNMPEFLKWTNENGIRVGFNHHPGALIPEDPKSVLFAKKTGINIDSLVKRTDSIYKVTKWENIKGTGLYGEENPAYIKPYFDTYLAPIMDLGLDFHWVDGTPSLENLKEYYLATENYNKQRAIVLTRQGSGSFDHHKYPIGFSADTYISWESLAYNIEITLKGANNGVYWSHDIGGHMGKNDDDFDKSELFTRWIQFGALTPFNRLHATGGVTLDDRKMHIRRPWLWNSTVLKSAKKIMQLKYKMMPYIYTLNRNAYDKGLIMTQGMYINYPSYLEAYKYSESQYMIGKDILVAPITKPSEDGQGIKGLGNKNLWIPPGVWYDYFSGDEVKGPIETMVKKPIDEIPLFFKEGAIIPTRTYLNYTDELPLENLVIEFYQFSKADYSSFDFYEDDGKTLEYKKDKYRWTTIDFSLSSTNENKITIYPTNGFYENNVTVRNYNLIIKHIDYYPKTININGKRLDAKFWSYQNNMLAINVNSYSVKEKLEVIVK